MVIIRGSDGVDWLSFAIVMAGVGGEESAVEGGRGGQRVGDNEGYHREGTGGGNGVEDRL